MAEKIIDVIKTERLILRPVRVDDLDEYYRIINDEGFVSSSKLFKYPYPKEDLKKFLEAVIDEMSKNMPNHLMFTIEFEGEMIGQIGLKRIDWEHRALLNYFLDNRFWGKGIMTEAVKAIIFFGFDELNLKRIYGETFLYNKGSQKVMEKSGMTFVGILRNHAKRDDELFACRQYEIIPEDLQK